MAEKSGTEPVPPPYTEPSAPIAGAPPAAPGYGYNALPGQAPVYNAPLAPGGYTTIPTTYNTTYQPPPPPGYTGVAAQPLPGQYGGVPVAAGTTIVVTTGPHNSRAPSNCVCPKCHQNVLTQVDYVSGAGAWILFGIICLLGGWVFCLCLIPFCINDLKDVHHICPNCRHTIAICRRA